MNMKYVLWSIEIGRMIIMAEWKYTFGINYVYYGRTFLLYCDVILYTTISAW